VGAVQISFTCLRQVDLKVLIAYSSVAHLGVVIIALGISSTFAFAGGIFVIVAHGLSSPGIFYGANCFYTRSGSRNMLLNSRLVQFVPTLGLWWFLFCIANMRAPPSGNLLAELIVVSGLVNTCPTLAMQLGFLIFLGGAYTLIAYSASQQGQKKTKVLDQGAPVFLRSPNFLLASTICIFYYCRSGCLLGVTIFGFQYRVYSKTRRPAVVSYGFQIISWSGKLPPVLTNKFVKHT